MKRAHRLLAAALALAGCGRDAPVRETAWFHDHAAERQAELARCRGDDARRASGANCLNALAAEAQAESERSLTYVRPKSRVQAPGGL